jgi:hypothetical protein
MQNVLFGRLQTAVSMAYSGGRQRTTWQLVHHEADHALEASPERLRDNIRRPLPGGRDLLTKTAGNTVREIVPIPAATRASP